MADDVGRDLGWVEGNSLCFGDLKLSLGDGLLQLEDVRKSLGWEDADQIGDEQDAFIILGSR